MIRFLLLSILVTLVYRTLARLGREIVRGMQGGAGGASAGPRAAGTPIRSVQMARDPICGTFVVPERAVTVVTGGTRFHFCSTACRDQYLAASPSTPAQPRSRTA